MMRILNNKLLILREKSQQKYGLIILPDSKMVTGKNCLIIAAGKIKLKETTIDHEVKVGDRVAVLQYDGLPIKAWKTIRIHLNNGEEKNIWEEKLPDGVTLWFSGQNDHDDNCTYLEIAKGTPLQLIDRDDIIAQLEGGFSLDDQKF